MVRTLKIGHLGNSQVKEIVVSFYILYSCCISNRSELWISD